MSLRVSALALRSRAREFVDRTLPGVMVCLVIALAATFLSEHYGGPQLLYALLIGLSLHFLSANPKITCGVNFCAKTVLRAGVALLGARITLDQVTRLGVGAGLVVLVALLLTILLGVAIAHCFKRPREEGLLSGGAVAICGASAAMAIASVLPQTRENERFTLLTVVAVTLLSTGAMVFYPYLLHLADFNAAQSGIFLGGTIHDVAQVVAAGMMVDQSAGEAATVVKLFRVMLLLPVVMLIALAYRKSAPAPGDGQYLSGLIPGFLLGFVALVVLGSMGAFSPAVTSAASSLSRWCLVLAISAAGVKTSFENLMELGWQPIAMLVAETVFIAALVMVSILVFGLGV